MLISKKTALLLTAWRIFYYGASTANIALANDEPDETSKSAFHSKIIGSLVGSAGSTNSIAPSHGKESKPPDMNLNQSSKPPSSFVDVLNGESTGT